jgi:hypothetical protein
MKTFIFIAGAPGSGKSTVAQALQHKLDSPLFEFGWIPEFRNTGDKVISYKEDEALAFENLALVAKNYAKHGFKNIIITDLESPRIGQLADVYAGYDYIIFTLRLKDKELLKSRVLNTSRSSKYRNYEESLRLNSELYVRTAYPNEAFIEVAEQSVTGIVESILGQMDTMTRQ